MLYYGQRTGKRDGLIQTGTFVAVRPKKGARYFDIIGKVLVKRCTREQEDKRPAEYKLLIEMYRFPRRENRSVEDKFAHNAVLRAIGLPIEEGAVAQGIYG